MKSSLNERPFIYLITSGEARDENFTREAPKILELIFAAKEARITAVQIREKKLSGRLLFELAKSASAIIKNSATKLLINERADIAVASGADGVHLRSDSVPADYVRESFGAEFLIGVSTHTLEEVAAAKRNGSDFVVFSPIFESHSSAPPKGIDSLREAVKIAEGFPVVALGGINETNLGECLRAGATGVAGIRLFGNSQRMIELVPKIRSQWK